MKSIPVGDQTITPQQIKEANEILNGQKKDGGIVLRGTFQGSSSSSPNSLNDQVISKGSFVSQEFLDEANLRFKPRSKSEESRNQKLTKDSVKSTIKLKTPPNPQKCIFSPYSFHRFARCHKEKLKDGSITLILRCRYCIEFQQVIIRFEKNKEGRYIAKKEVMPVNETIQNG